MITPRRTRLIHVPDLRAFQRVIAHLGLSAPLQDIRRSAIVVPTRAAARQLRRTLENLAFGLRDVEASTGPSAVVLPDLATREDLYELLRQRLPEPPERLSSFDREVILAACARDAAAAGAVPPFSLRPGLIAAMLDFYDELRRRQETIEGFDRVLSEKLAGEVDDRGAERLLRQTRFLAEAFRRYEARVAESGSADEHRLRELLLATPSADPLRHVLVTTSDWIGEMPGLTKADFDLLTRLPGLERIDLVSTTEILASGFHERVKEWLPEVEEVSGRELCTWREDPPPALDTPESADGQPVFAFTSRDREEELKAVARRLKAVWRDADPGVRPRLERTAVVFQRPLPYIYLARGVFGGARIPYQAVDAFPLAAEPYAAALDLVFTFVSAGYTRESIVALLGSPHFRFEHEGRVVGGIGVARLNEALMRNRFLGGLDELERLLAHGDPPRESGRDWALDALNAAVDAARALHPLTESAPASVHLKRLIAFLTLRDRAPHHDDPLAERRLRARGAVLAALQSYAAAAERFDDEVLTLDPLSATVRRWIEEQTFMPAAGSQGMHLIDAQAARYADLDDLHLVGLVEGEWPARPPRNIFYPYSLLSQLRWPSEQDRLGAARAAFQDLVRLPRRSVSASRFRLEDDAIVEPSGLLEELGDAGLPIVVSAEGEPRRIFPDEALAEAPAVVEAVSGTAVAWLALRQSRGPFEAPHFHGRTDPQPPRVYSASRIDLYRRCPFKYFAARVLGLDEEPDDDEAMAPRMQGETLHTLLEDFHARWDETRRDLTVETLDEARALFAQVVDEHLAGLPDADALLLRERLLGSAASGGAANSVLLIEIARGVRLEDRLLEEAFDGTFTFTAGESTREVQLTGQIDRLDLLEDGTFHLFDYKLGKPPGAYALQLPVYALVAEQWLLRTRTDGPWRFGEAAYVALRDRRVGGRPIKAGDRQLVEAQEQLALTVDAIERGDFPPRPAALPFCRTCGYASVCRKDYVNPDDREGDDRAD